MKKVTFLTWKTLVIIWTLSSQKPMAPAAYLSVEGSGQRARQQLARDSSESSQAETGLHLWLARLQLGWLGCRTFAAATGRCQLLRRLPSSLPGNLCWHGLAAPWQGRVDALEGQTREREIQHPWQYFNGWNEPQKCIYYTWTDT